MSRCRKILIAVICAILAVMLVAVARHYQLRAAANAYIAKLKAEGEPMDLAQVLPPPVPADQNSVPLITNALNQIHLMENFTNSLIDINPPLAMNDAMPGRQMMGWQQPFIHDPEGNGYYPTNTWDDLGAELIQRQNDLDDFRKLTQNPTLDFGYDYSDPRKYIPTLLERLSSIRFAARWLETSEFYNLHYGKTADACIDVRAELGLVRGETQERFEDCQLVRDSITQLSADPTWDILQMTNVTDAGLKQLQNDWESLELTTPLKNSFLFERVSELQRADHLREWPTNLNQEMGWKPPPEGVFQKMTDGVSARWDKFRWRWFGSYADEVRGIKMCGAIIQGTQRLGTNHSLQSFQSFIDTNFTLLGFNSVKNDPYAITSLHAYFQRGAVYRAGRAETIRNIVVTAIAIKRFEIQYHRLPQTLAEMVPGLLKQVPLDYMDGKPLRYRPNGDGTFLLYSVGPDGKDDGGNPGWGPGVKGSSWYWLNSHALDWVWPQPATVAEIEYYYAHHSRP